MRRNSSEITTGFLRPLAYRRSNNKRKRGGVVDTQDNLIPIPAAMPAPVPTQIPVWASAPSVIVCLSPVIMFYLLMVA